MKNFLLSLLAVFVIIIGCTVVKSYSQTTPATPYFTVYRILGSKDAGNLEDQVNGAIRDGWKLVGGASHDDGSFYQAVAK